MLSDISKILSIDVQQYLTDYTNFVNLYNQSLIDYYTAEAEYPKTSFDELDKLLRTSLLIYQQIPICRTSLNSYFAFETMDVIEDVISSLQTIDNYSRWLRTSFVKGRFKENVEIDFILKQNQTLEELSSDIGFSDREEGVLSLTLRNHIKEKDYDLSGGLLFQFNYQNDQQISLNTVIDTLTGENILGKDLSKKFSLKENDLLTLNPRDTFYQTCAILTSLLKNSNPQYPDQGFNKASISNKNALANMLPTFIRQLYATINEDDTIESFRIVNIITDADALKIQIEYKSHLSYEVTQIANGN